MIAVGRLPACPAEQVVLDVGIGFGKTLEHNLQLLAGLRSFTKWRRPLLLGVSRKSFIKSLLGAETQESFACGARLHDSGAGAGGVQIIRTHDVAETCRRCGWRKRFWPGTKNVE